MQRRVLVMPDYRLYFVGHDGRFAAAKDIECDNDADAIEQAQRFIDGRDIELWERGLFIVRFPSDSPLQA
jgi:hypothetical protein